MNMFKCYVEEFSKEGEAEDTGKRKDNQCVSFPKEGKLQSIQQSLTSELIDK